MKLLLDTHTFLWFIGGDSKLSSIARSLIEDSANERLLSIASVWEMAIKSSIGRLQFAQPFQDFVSQQITLNDISIFKIATRMISRGQAELYPAVKGKALCQ